MSAGGDVTASEAVSVGARRELPAFRVSRSTRLHLVVLIVSVGIVVLLAQLIEEGEQLRLHCGLARIRALQLREKRRDQQSFLRLSHIL